MGGLTIVLICSLTVPMAIAVISMFVMSYDSGDNRINEIIEAVCWVASVGSMLLGILTFLVICLYLFIINSLIQ